MIPESTYRQPTPDCPHPELWSSPDGTASEYELQDFIYGLVRLLKPAVVLETGCYLGYTSEAIGRALRHNNYGHLHTCDIEPQHVTETRARTQELPITAYHTTGIELITLLPSIDLAFLDSGSASERHTELTALKLSPTGLALVHDARSFNHQPDLFISTPRGLAIYRAQERQ